MKSCHRQAYVFFPLNVYACTQHKITVNALSLVLEKVFEWQSRYDDPYSTSRCIACKYGSVTRACTGIVFSHPCFLPVRSDF